MPLYITLSSSQASFPLHVHDFSELVIVLKGEGVHRTKWEEYAIGEGDTFVIPPGDPHGYGKAHGLAIANVLFNVAELRIPLQDLRRFHGYQAFVAVEPALRKRHGTHPHLRLSPSDLAVVRVLVTDIKREIDAKRPGYQAMAAALFLQTIGLVSRCYARVKDPENHPLLKLGSVLSFIEIHYAQPISLTQLANTAHMSKSTLHRAFMQSLGTSPVDYLIRFRVRKAIELLRRRDLNVTDVAFSVGFMDSNYFSRQFHKIAGMSPRQHRMTILRAAKQAHRRGHEEV